MFEKDNSMKWIFIGIIALSTSIYAAELFAADISKKETTAYPADAPWPSMRADFANSGKSRNLEWKGRPGIASEVRYFHTGNGIFSTPIIDGQDRIYVGSADHYFYAFDPRAGKQLWKFDANEIIDSAACLGKDGALYVPAGDAKLHALDPNGNELWSFDVLNNRAKRNFSLSTNFWFEANVVIGPDGYLYAANDDFFLYKLDYRGKIVWAYRTGLLIWSAAAFSNDGKTVFIAGFDMKLYALETETGKLKWKTDLENSLVASSAVGSDGTIYQGTFGGDIFAVDGETGKIKWKIETGNHIYASAAAAADGTIYVGSTDGALYAIDGAAGKVKWTYYIGDAIRSSASIGPDPEGKSQYLVYFGGGDGLVYAVDPAGKHRWSFDIAVLAADNDYPNINASVALGNDGLAVADANGGVIWIPYDYYLKTDANGIELKHAYSSETAGARWHYVSTGGHFIGTPLSGEKRIINPSEVISLRLIQHAPGAMRPARIDAASVKISPTPSFGFLYEIQSDGSTINIIPDEILEPGREYKLEIEASYFDDKNNRQQVAEVISIQTTAARKDESISSGAMRAFEITHMAMPQPAIIPSLNQIGIASLTIPFSIVYTDAGKGSFVAWAAQRFGETETGDQLGVPDRRSLYYAFSGKSHGDFFTMESFNCYFEMTAFPIELDIFRLAGRIGADGKIETGSSLYIEKYVGKNAPPVKSVSFDMIMSRFKTGGLIQFVGASGKFLGASLSMMSRKTWIDWGMINEAGKLLGVGTFRMHSTDSEKKTNPEIEALSFAFDPSKNEIVAEVKQNAGPGKRSSIVGILIVDKSTCKAAPINYNTATEKQTLKSGNKRVTLRIPKNIKINSGAMRAFLMVELEAVKEIDF